MISWLSPPFSRSSSRRSNRKNERFYHFCIHLFHRSMILCWSVSRRRSVSLRPLKWRIPRRRRQAPLKMPCECSESVIRIHCQSNTCPLHPYPRLRWFPLNRHRSRPLYHSAFLGLIFFFRLFILLFLLLPVCLCMWIFAKKRDRTILTWSQVMVCQSPSLGKLIRLGSWFSMIERTRCPSAENTCRVGDDFGRSSWSNRCSDQEAIGTITFADQITERVWSWTLHRSLLSVHRLRKLS